jgi:hypothetical protein
MLTAATGMLVSNDERIIQIDSLLMELHPGDGGAMALKGCDRDGDNISAPEDRPYVDAVRGPVRTTIWLDPWLLNVSGL